MLLYNIFSTLKTFLVIDKKIRSFKLEDSLSKYASLRDEYKVYN